MTQRSGCLHLAMTRLISRPDELDAITTSGGSAASMAANRSIFTSSRSGPLSCTNSAPSTAAAGVAWKLKAFALAPGATQPSFSSVGQALSMKRRAKLSPCGEGSLAPTAKPRARKIAAQLAPMVPAPITATRRVMGNSLLVD